MTRPTRPSRPVLLVLASVLAVLLSGCTGVPTSSSPETIQPIDVGGTGSGEQAGPTPGIDPRTLVSRFLDANTVDPADHRTARRYLTSTARNRWSDRSATIVSTTSIGIYTPNKPITVRGRIVGTLKTTSGIFSPSLVSGGESTFNFTVEQVRGQWRISGVPTGVGLLLTSDQFKQNYKEHSVYFFDNAHSLLVPDSRWTALTGRPLNTWLLGQLVTGPRPELSNTVSTDVLPPQTQGRRMSTSGTEPIKIDVPGSSQLGREAKRRLAAQVGVTLVGPGRGDLLALTDGGTEVSLPGRGSDTEFTTAGLSSYVPDLPAADVYYLRQTPQRLLRGTEGAPIRGKLDPRNYDYFFSSVAVSASAPGKDLTVAAVSGTGSASRLVVGDQSDGYRVSSLRGEMTRPAWAPGSTELWVGVGSKLYRAPVAGNVLRPQQVSIPSAAGGGRIRALRLSPEGSRIAMVIESAGRERQLFVGSVVRSAGQVRVDPLQSITPAGERVDDVAWLGSVRLIAIGATGGGVARIFESNVDGALWTSKGLGALPDPPDSITAAANQFAWVSTRGTVWEQSGSDWAPAGASSQTPGDKPVYLE